MTRGEVWRVRLPSVPGHTQAGTRPAIILQADQATAALPTVLIVPSPAPWRPFASLGPWRFSQTDRTVLSSLQSHLYFN